TDLGRNTRTTGGNFDTSNGAHFATNGVNLFLLEGSNSTRLSYFNGQYVPKAACPETVQDGGDFQYGDGFFYYATVGLGFDTTTGAGNGPRLYAFNFGTNSWAARASTTVAAHPVCNEALAYDPSGNRVYGTIVQVQTAGAGGDPSNLSKLAIYNPASNAWIGATSGAPDSWAPGSEAEYLDGKVYVWRGGFSGGAVNGSDSYLDV